MLYLCMYASIHLHIYTYIIMYSNTGGLDEPVTVKTIVNENEVMDFETGNAYHMIVLLRNFLLQTC